VGGFPDEWLGRLVEGTRRGGCGDVVPAGIKNRRNNLCEFWKEMDAQSHGVPIADNARARGLVGG
jgi:hypothetical protein